VQLEIEGLIVNVAHNHGSNDQPASHVVAMGRFNTNDGRDHSIRISLFGKAPAEKSFQITITHGSKKEKVVLSEQSSTHRLFDT
jgi:hypothetical protein